MLLSDDVQITSHAYELAARHRTEAPELLRMLMQHTAPPEMAVAEEQGGRGSGWEFLSFLRCCCCSKKPAYVALARATPLVATERLGLRN